MKVQPSDQAIVVAGPAGTRPDGTISKFGVERYDSVGNVDTSYGSAGLASPTLGPGQSAEAVYLQADGKAVVAGQVVIAGGVNVGLARLNMDGSPDTTFGSAGWTGFDFQPGTDAATAVGLQSTGKIVIAGNSNSAPPFSAGTVSALVARFKANGAIDSGTGGFGQLSAKKPTGYALTSFGAKSASYNDVAVQPDDKLVAVGYDGSSHLVVARYTVAGTLDKTFNSRGYTVLSPVGISTLYGGTIALQADGKIVVGGGSSGADGASDMLIARFNANGSLDTSFGSGNGYVRLDVDGAASVTSEGATGVAIQPDGKIVVAGDTKPGVGGAASVMVARLNTNGTLDSTFGAGGLKLGTPLAGTGYHDFRGRAVALQSDGSIIVAGIDYWGNSGDTQHPLLMRFFGTNSALAPTEASSTRSAAAVTDTALTLLLNEDMTSSSLKKNAASALQTGTPANTSSLRGNGTPTGAALTTVASLVQKSSTSNSGLGKIASSDLVLSLDDWFGSLATPLAIAIAGRKWDATH